MAKHILVTGGSGFLGSHLVRRLATAGHRVRVIDDNSRGALRRLADVRDDIEFVEGDIRDADAVHDAVEGVDCVAHLAYVNGTEFFYSKPDLVLEVGIRGTLNVLDACFRHGVSEFVLASTSETYQTPPVVPTPEDVPLTVPDVLNPRYSYGGGKIACELMAVNFGRSRFERLMIFRPHNVYGPDMGWEHVLPQFALRAADLVRRMPAGPLAFPIQGDGTQTRAFVHVDDFTDGLMCVLERGAHMSIYHIGNPEEVAIAEVARKVVRTFGREADIIPGEPARGASVRRCPDISKLRALGYSPRIPLDAGLPSLVEWYAAHADERARAADAPPAVRACAAEETT